MRVETTLFSYLREVFCTWRDRARSRRQLAALSPEQLRDIGLTEGQATREAGRPFWDHNEKILLEANSLPAASFQTQAAAQ